MCTCLGFEVLRVDSPLKVFKDWSYGVLLVQSRDCCFGPDVSMAVVITTMMIIPCGQGYNNMN